MAILYAQDAPNWGTTVKEQDSIGELVGILYKLGAEKVQVGKQKIKEKDAIIVRFEWPKGSEMYRRFEFVPLPIRSPRNQSWREPTENQLELARCQAARRAVHLMKQLVSFFATMPELMTGFTEVPQLGMTEDGLIRTVGELEHDPEMLKALPQPR